MTDLLARLVTALALAGYTACAVPQQPPGPPTPPPADPSPVCVPPGLVTGCYHMPAGEWLYIPATPAPPSDATNCDGPVVDPPLAVTRDLGEHVNAAILRAFGCDGGRCLVNASRYEVQRRIIAELRAVGLCAGQHEPGSSPTSYGSDEIAVSASRTGLRESYHVVEGPAAGPVTLGLSPQSARPAYMPAGGPAPAPTPTPGPTPTPAPPAGCPVAPCPDLVWTEASLPDGWSRDEIGRPRLQFNSSLYVGRWIDNTLVVVRNEPYCASIGMSPYADGQPRASCPVRPDGHADRSAVEAWASQGFRLEAKPGAACSMHPTNPVMFDAGNGCRLCTVRTFKDGLPLCSEWR